MRSTYKIIDENYPYFLTSTIVNWINVFNSEKYFEIMLSNMKFYQNKYNIDVIAYVLMQNHFHMIFNHKELRKAIQSLKSYTSKELISQLKEDNDVNKLKEFNERKSVYKTESRYQIWQEGYHPKQIINYKMLKQKIEYIHQNPVRKKLVEKAEDWKYSSARYYMNGEDCGIDITPYY